MTVEDTHGYFKVMEAEVKKHYPAATDISLKGAEKEPNGNWFGLISYTTEKGQDLAAGRVDENGSVTWFIIGD